MRRIEIDQRTRHSRPLFVGLPLSRRQPVHQVGPAGADEAGGHAAFPLDRVDQIAEAGSELGNDAQIPHLVRGAEVAGEYPQRQCQHADDRQRQRKPDAYADAKLVQSGQRQAQITHSGASCLAASRSSAGTGRPNRNP